MTTDPCRLPPRPPAACGEPPAAYRAARGMPPVPLGVLAYTIEFMCSNVRVLAAASAGYLFGSLTGSPLASWLIALAAGVAMLAWSRISARRGISAGCSLPAVPGAHRRERAVTPAIDPEVLLGPAPGAAGAPGAATAAGGPGAAGPGAATGGVAGRLQDVDEDHLVVTGTRT